MASDGHAEANEVLTMCGEGVMNSEEVSSRVDWIKKPTIKRKNNHQRRKVMRLRSLFSLFSLLLIGSLLVGLVGCGTPAPPTATEVPTEPPAPATPTTAAPPEEKPVIVIAVSTDIDHINPYEFRSLAGYEATANLYEAAIMQTLLPEENGILQGVSEYGPGVATAVTVDEENAIITLTIPDGLKFANGNPMTAESFKFMYDVAAQAPTSYMPVLMPYMGLASHEDIVVVDDNTLEFHLQQLTPLSLAIMAFTPLGALDEVAYQEQVDAGDEWAVEWLRRNAAGSGPYVMTKWEQGVEYVFEPNPNYWQGEDYFQNSKVILRVVPSAEDRELLLRQGDVDVAMGLPPRNMDDLDADACCKVLPIDTGRIYYAGMNNKLPPFDNQALRQAISYAIPYDTILEEVLYGYAKTPGSPIPVGMPTHTDEFAYDTDLDMARQKLEEAGYADGLDVELTVQMMVSENVEAATWIQASLAEIGVNVTINRLPTAEFMDLLNQHQLPFFIHEWDSWGNDPSYELSFNYLCGQFTNYTDYCNERVDELIKTTAWSLDPEVKEAGMLEAQQIIQDEAPRAFLYQPDWLVVATEDFHGYAVTDDALMRFAGMGKTTE
ncbi:MAG TPA: ABC transporter substrate-binding protein [Anaerolineae bacterium]|nr:ABC transporter substrate-binding protein [Anaerolineae bacterium]